jgi:hypothetical protein
VYGISDEEKDKRLTQELDQAISLLYTDKPKVAAIH